MRLLRQILALLAIAACTVSSQAQFVSVLSASGRWAGQASDQFQRANSALTTPWVVTAGAPQIVGDVVEAGSVATGQHAYYGGTFSANQFSTTVISSQATAGCSPGPVVLLSGASPTESFYQFSTNAALGPSSSVALIKVVAGSFTLLQTTTTALNAGDALTLESVLQSDGSVQLNGYRNGIFVTTFS